MKKPNPRMVTLHVTKRPPERDDDGYDPKQFAAARYLGPGAWVNFTHGAGVRAVLVRESVEQVEALFKPQPMKATYHRLTGGFR